MCCSRINVETLLANLFAKSPEGQYSLSDLQNYLNFLTEHFPVYVASDFSEQAIRECVGQYPMLYQMQGQTDDFVVYPGEQLPNLSYFNAIYSTGVSKYLADITDSFLNHQ